MFWYRTVFVFARFVGAILIGVALLFLLTFILPYFEGASNFGYVRSMLALEKVVSTAVRDTIPTKMGGIDLTRWIIIVVVLTLSSCCDALSAWAHARREYHLHRKSVDARREQTHLSENAILLTPLYSNLEQLKTAKKGGDREQLLKEFAETKKKLDEMGRDLAFLAIDVVDSTGMKQ